MKRLLVVGVLVVAAAVGVIVVDRALFTPTILNETSGGPPPYETRQSLVPSEYLDLWPAVEK